MTAGSHHNHDRLVRDDDSHEECEMAPLVVETRAVQAEQDEVDSSRRSSRTSTSREQARPAPSPLLPKRPRPRPRQRRKQLRCCKVVVGWWSFLGIGTLFCGVGYFVWWWIQPRASETPPIAPSNDRNPEQTKRPSASPPLTDSFVPFDYAPIPSLVNKGSEYYSLESIRERFDRAYQSLLQRLQDAYGVDVLQSGLLGQQNPTDAPPVSAFQSPGGQSNNNVSRDRWKRQLMLKLLQVQLRLPLLEIQSHNVDKLHDDDRMVSYVWASGGHSAAAAHGNLYNESYTAVLERTVQEIFAQTGLWFQSRNYAMGGTASGPEVAHCEDAIFGLDMDVLSWDFGMTDGRNTAIFELYFTRAGIHPNRPIGVGIETQGGGASERLKVMQHLEDSGFPMLYLDDRVKANAIAVLPDCATGLMSEAEIAALPPYIRNFKCNGAIEKGGPHCDTSKWTNVTDYCPTRPKFRTGWHPGWKWHALIGNLLGLSLIGVLDDALKDLERELSTTSPRDLFDKLKAQEDVDSTRFLESAISQDYVDMLDPKPSRDDALNVAGLFRSRSVCHTAVLPSESRYKGILTMDASHGGFHAYEKGLPREQADRDDSNSSKSIRLVYDASDRQNCNILEVDYKDYFYVSAREGWKQAMLPNQAELDVYRDKYTNNDWKGLIAIVLKPCSWGRCKPDDVREDGLELGQFEIQVNGVQVTNLTKAYTMRFLRHENGHAFAPKKSGQYEIRIRVKDEGKSLRLTSLVFF